ncbi:hypothetical protein IAR55_000817 [Kwoniella newhampshirensis]|uniref:Chromatin structure-remodeling complex subunit SFH1 n=1 Tax=Kwoniella newhampshirensis TaxID=1651941 RepID=A0AAW0Z4H9_9TREE
MPARQPNGFSFPPPGWPSNTMSVHDSTRATLHPSSSQPLPQPRPHHIPPPDVSHQYPNHPQFSYVPPSLHHYGPYPIGPVQHLQPPPPPPNIAYPPSAGSYRGNHAQPTPTRSSHQQQPPPPMYGSHHRQSNGHGHASTARTLAAVPSYAPAIYRHPGSYPPGPLPFFLPPPGQPTSDPSLSTAPTSQALHTTYPSRLRTGVTGLIQPEHITGGPRERELFMAEMDREMNISGRGGSGASTPRYDSPTPFNVGGGGAGTGGGRRSTAAVASSAALGLSGRRGRVVNYAEKASDDEDDDDDDESELSEVDEPASDPEDETFGRKKRGPGRPRKDRDSSMFGAGGDHHAASKVSKLRKKKDEMERGWTWLGDRTPGERVRSQPARGTKHAYTSEELLEAEADRPELLVPIIIDLDVPSNNPDHQGIKVKDRFLWNINEPFIDTLHFSVVFCEDVGIPAHPHASVISELIKAQLEEHQNVAEIDISNEEVTEEDVVFSDDEVDDAMEVDGGAEEQDNGAEEVDAEAEEEKDAREKERDREQAWEEADCRIIVNLDVQIYSHILRDRIEWDLSSSLPPSTFAKQYCTELGLTGEAIPLVTFAIHEELLKHKRDALEMELFAATHPEEQAKWERGALPRVNMKRGPKGLVGVWRDWWEKEEFGPILVELTMEEMEKREYERTREARRMMRTLTTNKRRR